MAKKTVNIKLGKGWKELIVWTRAFQGRLDKSMTRGMKKVLQLAKARIIEGIEAGDFERNTELVVFLKRVRGINLTPLLGEKGSIMKAINTEFESPVSGKVGLLANRRTKSGEELSNIGMLLHDGGTIRVTDKMRASFARFIGALENKFNFELAKRSSAGGTIKIPARKFIQDVIESRSFQEEAHQIFFEEIKIGAKF